MIYYIGTMPAGQKYLAHYGVLGMKWGVRRYETADGHLTSAGKARYYGKYGPYDSQLSGHETNHTVRSAGKSAEVSKRKNETFWTDERKQKIKKAAKVVGVAAAVGAVGYVAMRPQIIEGQAAVNYMTTRYATQLSKMPISSLSDNDTVLKSGTIVQRVIRDYGDVGKALDMDKKKDFIYGAINDEDKKFYRTLFRSVGEGRNAVTTREVISDIRMPSARKRINTFLDGFSNKEFSDAFVSDMRDIVGKKNFTADKLDRMSDREKQALYSTFFRFAGNAKSKSAKIYFSNIRNMGYQAISDDNDGGYITNTPTIFLNASNDTMVLGYKYASTVEKITETVSLKNILGSLSIDNY